MGFVLAEFIEDEQGLSLSDPARFSGAVGPIRADEIGRTWQRRSGRNDSVAVEWFESEDDGLATYVILVAAVAELRSGLEEIVLPALETIVAVEL